MASFVGFDGEYESCEWSYPSLNISHDVEESVLASYRRVTSEYEFTSIRAFQGCCLNRQRKYRDGSSSLNEYILFTGVTLECMSMVDTARRLLPKMCCLYDADDQVLIVKLMVGMGHESISFRFYEVLSDKLKVLGLCREVMPLGSARFGDTRRHKEADLSFKPVHTRLAEDDWPSMVYEVGFSESLAQLRLDAHYWLTRSPSHMRTNIVILIHVKRDEREMEIERWEVVNPRRQHRVHVKRDEREMEIERWEVVNPRCQHRGNVQYHCTCECVQRIELSEGIVYAGPPLEIPVQKVFDIVPPNLGPHALDYTSAELHEVNETFWDNMP